MSAHTPEPWKIRRHWGDNAPFMIYPGVCYEITNEADAARIVACVNACAGMSDLDVSSIKDRYNARMAEIDALRDQRDELLAALDQLVFACEYPGDTCEVGQALPRAIAILAKVKP